MRIQRVVLIVGLLALAYTFMAPPTKQAVDKSAYPARYTQVTDSEKLNRRLFTIAALTGAAFLLAGMIQRKRIVDAETPEVTEQ
jgi:hypothetical protein